MYRYTITKDFYSHELLAEGVVFSDGSVVLRWMTEDPGMVIYPSVVQLLKYHGQKKLGGLYICWVDGIPPEARKEKEI